MEMSCATHSLTIIRPLIPAAPVIKYIRPVAPEGQRTLVTLGLALDGDVGDFLASAPEFFGRVRVDRIG